MKYTATLTVMGQKHTALGSTAIDAVKALKVKNAKGKGVLSITNGKETREKVFMPQVLYRLFNSVGLNREVAMKNISILFDGL